MGEYAKRNSDGQEIKIGTCEDMYYIRFEDRDKVSPLPNSISLSNPAHVDGCRFRLPFPDENGKQPGEYENYNRGLRLYKVLPCEWCKGSGKSDFETNGKCRRCHGSGTDGHEDYAPVDTLDSVGNIQLHHKDSGLLINVPCYHGLKLPEVTAPMKAFWNGKGHAFELSSLKAMLVDGGWFNVLPIIRCRFCGEAWRSEWKDIADYLPADWRFLLERYAAHQRETVIQ